MQNKEAVDTVNSARRKLLQVGVYSIPAVLLIGTASEAIASGRFGRRKRKGSFTPGGRRTDGGLGLKRRGSKVFNRFRRER